MNTNEAQTRAVDSTIKDRNNRLIRISNIISCLQHAIQASGNVVSEADKAEFEVRIYVLQRRVADECNSIMLDDLYTKYPRKPLKEAV